MDRFFVPGTPFNLDLSDNGNPTPGTVCCLLSFNTMNVLTAHSLSASGANGRAATSAGVSSKVRNDALGIYIMLSVTTA